MRGLKKKSGNTADNTEVMNESESADINVESKTFFILFFCNIREPRISIPKGPLKLKIKS